LTKIATWGKKKVKKEKKFKIIENLITRRGVKQ